MSLLPRDRGRRWPIPARREMRGLFQGHAAHQKVLPFSDCRSNQKISGFLLGHLRADFARMTAEPIQIHLFEFTFVRDALMTIFSPVKALLLSCLCSLSSSPGRSRRRNPCSQLNRSEQL